MLYRKSFIIFAVLMFSTLLVLCSFAFAELPEKPGNPGVPGLLAEITELNQMIADQNLTIQELQGQINDLQALLAVMKNYAPVSKTGQTTCYDSSGMETACTGTGQDGALQEGVAWPNPRFTENVNAADDTGTGTNGIAGNGICDGTEICNGTITDNLTGLIWLKNANCPNGGLLGQDALDFVAGINNGSNDCGDTSNPGHPGNHQNDWRLPNVRELQSLVDYGLFGPSLPSGHPFTNFQASNYWSSTTDIAYGTFYGWVVNFFFGNVGPNSKTNVSNFVIAVRGGP